jgi:cytochrome P450 family 4
VKLKTEGYKECGNMFFLTVIVIVAIAGISWYRKRFERRDFLCSKIPHPKKWPIVHNSLEFIGKTPKELFDWMENTANEFGSVYYFSTGVFGSTFAVVSDVKVVEALLSSQSQLDKTVDYDYLVPWTGTGLLISSGKKWFTRRKLLTPGFHFSILEKFVEIMNDQGNVFVENLKKYDGKQVDIFPLTNFYALDTVCGM